MLFHRTGLTVPCKRCAHRLAIAPFILAVLLTAGCSQQPAPLPEPVLTASAAMTEPVLTASAAMTETTTAEATKKIPEETVIPAASPSPPAIQTTKAAEAPPAAAAAPSVPAGSRLAGTVVVLDPGHQRHANNNLEPIAPSSSEMKIKTSSGTAGVVTRRSEYLVNLEISLLMRDYLEAQGCLVYLTRTSHDVDISNIERAKFALSYDPDVYIRVHCNGSTDSLQTGTSVYVANSGVYASQLLSWGKSLADCLCQYTGARDRGAYANASYSGLNWAAGIPAFLLEMGYMTNPAEDRLLSDPDYQRKICQGIVDFVAMMPQR